MIQIFPWLFMTKAVASNLHGTRHREFLGRRTDLSKKALWEVQVELPLKCNRMWGALKKIPLSIKKEKKNRWDSLCSIYLLTWSNMTFLNWAFIKEKAVCLNHRDNSPLTAYPTKVSYCPLIAVDLAFFFFFGIYFCMWKTYERVLYLFVSICVYTYNFCVCIHMKNILCVAMYIKVYTYYHLYIYVHVYE